ncbi:hypothetical protein [Marixanthomonas spongiae]|uniref:Uncharacterized protein n=1 Tax=Marixanthomonas spongiae TaxID=2174845 RepID=A0A2U0HX47_9FLAO|nr:hypothetical protein [Marixanthomonas spongiae]PVW13399.1 hypothetical protein DDV96_13615 [Marixanthomonas spongiae]
MNYKATIYIFSILCFGLLFASCQKEESEFIDETDQDETITTNSTLANLLLRTSQNPGGGDDIIDGNSCTQVKYPVTVIANGQEVVLESEADIALIQAIFDQFPNDTDTLEIVFPITLILKDFTEIEVNSQAELDALADACDGDTAISCVDFVYSISFFVYNTENEQTTTVIINSDVELYLFLFNLDEDEVISIDFPISVILQDGSTVAINNNQELEDLLDNVDCNDDGEEELSEFEENLTTGNWYVTYFFDDFDETGDFSGYEFTFATDNTAQATNGSTTIDGTWNLTTGSTPKLDLFFGANDPFDELDEDWELLEATSEIIRLKHISGGDGSVDYLTFERTPNTGGNNEEVNILIENLTTGSWYITLFQDDGDDETTNYNGYEFTFFIDGSATAVSTDQTVNGFWAVETEEDDVELVFNFNHSGEEDPFKELNDDWMVVEATQLTIRLSDESGSGQNDLLTFEREPNGNGGNDPDPQELRDILQAGTWYVDTFLDDGEDETSVFNGYDFTFSSSQTVTANNGSETVYGIWIVSVVGEALNFEFDMDSPINDADDDEYKVLQFSETSVTFIIRDSEGNIEDTLTFKKN